MTRIGIDARFLLRPLRGMPLYALRLCENLPGINRDWEFIYFINKGFEHNDLPDNYIPRLEKIEQENSNVQFVNHDDDAEIFWEQYYLPRLVKKYKIDLLHMPGNRCCFFAGVPTVVTVHDVMEYIYLKKSLKKQLSEVQGLKSLIYVLRCVFYKYLNYKYGIPKASRIVTVSKASEEDLIKVLSCSSFALKTIYHGLSEEYLNIKPKTFSARKHVLLLGGDNYFKNPQLAIKAWARLDSCYRNQYKLKIVGFSGDVKSSLLESIKECGLDNDIEINGWVSQQEMVACFRNAIVFLFPSRYEGFGFPLIQAMACGTPIVSTNRSSIPEVLNGAGLLVDPDDIDGMQLAIKRLLSDEAYWHEQSELGLNRALSFRWKASAEEHYLLYKELL